MIQVPLKPPVRDSDSLQIYRRRTWAQFKLIQKGLEAAAGLRLCFFQDTIEVSMPGRSHGIFKKIIAILLEAFLLDRNIDFIPTGSMDHELANIAAAQPDESYEIGNTQQVEQSHIPELSEIDIPTLSQCILMGETQINQALQVFRAKHPA
jgi:hypothetical protein